MKRSTAGRSALVTATIAAVLTLSKLAFASGFAAARFGGENGSVTTTNPTALYYNPAGIALASGDEWHVFLDGTLALRRQTWDHTPGPSEDPNAPGAGTNFGRATLFNVFGGPMAGVSKRFGSLALGTSLSVPFGGRAHWNQIDNPVSNAAFPLSADGVQRWHGITGGLTFIYLTAGAAWRIGRLSLGLAGNFILSSVKTTQAKTPVGRGVPDATREGRSILDVSGKHGSFGAGALYEALESRLWLGVSYQAQPALGPMTLKGTLTQTYQDGTLPFDVHFHQALPDIYRFGARYRPIEDVEVRLSGDYTRWSVMRTQCLAVEKSTCIVDSTGANVEGSGVLQNLRRYWKDTYGVHGGVSRWFGPRLELQAGVGWETAAVPDETLDPALADANNIAITLGGRFEVRTGWYLATSYTHIQYLDRDNTGKSQLADAEPPTSRADGGGKYTQWVGVFDVNLEMQF